MKIDAKLANGLMCKQATLCSVSLIGCLVLLVLTFGMVHAWAE
ncbi:MAG: hypothetical protein ABFD75_03130 [Smithella sp.]